MSVEQRAVRWESPGTQDPTCADPKHSVGDSKPQDTAGSETPTPTEHSEPSDVATPTDSTFSTDVYQTPRSGSSHRRQGSDLSKCWETPRYAEEFSLFNATPGNLRPYQPPTPYLASLAQGASGTTAGGTTTTNSKRPRTISIQGPPLQPIVSLVDVQKPVELGHSNNTRLPTPADATDETVPPAGLGLPLPPPPPRTKPGERTIKRARTGTITATPPTHSIATPPPSSEQGRKGVASTNMDRTDDLADGFAAHNDPLSVMIAGGGGGGDLFGYPLSAPAAGSFWGSSSMDMDMLSSAGMYSSAHPDMMGGSFGWPADGDGILFSQPQSLPSQEAPPPPPPQKQPKPQQMAPQAPPPPQPQTTKKKTKPRPLASKRQQEADLGLASSLTSSRGDEYDGAGNVNPGLVFPRSASIESVAFASSPGLMQAPFMRDRSLDLPGQVLASSPSLSSSLPRSGRSSPAKSASLRRSATNPPSRPPRKKKTTATTAPKPILARPRPLVQTLSRPSTGRISPFKRPPLPSSSSDGFTLELCVDDHGRAYTEARVMSLGRSSASSVHSGQLHGSPAPDPDDGDYDGPDGDDSSSDDEPIIIPSRAGSFVLPDPLHGLPEDSTPSSAAYSDVRPGSSSMHSEAETMATEECDAVSELARLVEGRNKVAKPRYGRTPTVAFAAAAAEARRVRCVCRGGDDGQFMVQCKSCDAWLHGACVNMSRGTQTALYICAFCANTPLVQGLPGASAPVPVPVPRRLAVGVGVPGKILKSMR